MHNWKSQNFHNSIPSNILAPNLFLQALWACNAHCTYCEHGRQSHGQAHIAIVVMIHSCLLPYFPFAFTYCLDKVVVLDHVLKYQSQNFFHSFKYHNTRDKCLDFFFFFGDFSYVVRIWKLFCLTFLSCTIILLENCI